MPQTRTTQQDEQAQKTAALALLRENREAWEQLRRTRHHLIAAAYNAGLSEQSIADELGLSRAPVREFLAAARGAGELRRAARPPRAR